MIYVVVEGDEYESVVAVFTDPLLAQQCANDDYGRYVQEFTPDSYELKSVHGCEEPPMHGPITRDEHERIERAKAFDEAFSRALKNLHPPSSIEDMVKRHAALTAFMPGTSGVFKIG